MQLCCSCVVQCAQRNNLGTSTCLRGSSATRHAMHGSSQGSLYSRRRGSGLKQGVGNAKLHTRLSMWQARVRCRNSRATKSVCARMRKGRHDAGAPAVRPRHPTEGCSTSITLPAPKSSSRLHDMWLLATLAGVSHGAHRKCALSPGAFDLLIASEIPWHVVGERIIRKLRCKCAAVRAARAAVTSGQRAGHRHTCERETACTAAAAVGGWQTDQRLRRGRAVETAVLVAVRSKMSVAGDGGGGGGTLRSR